MPPQLMGYAARQVVDNLVFQKMVEIDGKRLGVSVSKTEVADRIKTMLPPEAIQNGAVKRDVYESLVAQTGMSIEEFEDAVRQAMVMEKVGKLVTAGASVTPEEVETEFKRKNEKIKMEYVVVRPDLTESHVQPSDAELNAYLEKNKASYQMPEQRVIRYILIDPANLLAKVTVSDADVQAYYNAHLADYKVPDRALISIIQFKTIGKTDAEISEIRKKADDVAREAIKPGARFDELAKKYSDDSASKEKGGDIGWITRGQLLPEMERAAFSLPKGSVSGAIPTQLGIFIIKVADSEPGHTKIITEVRPLIVESLTAGKAQAVAEEDAKKIGELAHGSTHPSLDEIAKQFGLTVNESKPVSQNDAIPELGSSPELSAALFSLGVGEVSQSLPAGHGRAVISIKSISPARPGTLEEVRAKLILDFRKDKAADQAKQRAADLAKRAQSGQDFVKTAKALSLDAKTSDLISRDDSIPNVGKAAKFVAAFDVPGGKTGDPILIGVDWLVYQIADHQAAAQADFDMQKKGIEEALLNAKRQVAFDAYHKTLEEKFKAEGKLTFNKEAMLKLAGPEPAMGQPPLSH